MRRLPAITKSEIKAAKPHFDVEKYFSEDLDVVGDAVDVLEKKGMPESYRLWVVFSLPNKIPMEVRWWFNWWCVDQALKMLKKPNPDVAEGFSLLASGKDIQKEDYILLYERVSKETVLAAVSGQTKETEKASIVYNMGVQSAQKENTMKLAHTLYGLKRESQKGRRLRWRGHNPVQALIDELR